MTQRLRERYEVLETLGGGGEGRFVKALDHQHGRPVALKILSVRKAADRDDLLAEARILLDLAPHPALPLVREDFFEGDEYVIAMDWVDGTNLARLLRSGGHPGLAPSSVLTYLADAADALTYLHTQDPPVIHGNVKPANLILTRGGRVKLVDFGMSSVPGSHRRRAGTPGFRAPELGAGSAPSRSSDVYALAATAFTLLSGSVPSGVSPTWHGMDPDQATHLEEVIRLGLATDPARRPPTPGEFVERLRAGWGASLPTGVMTFCLTDIVGSTALWEQRPGAMASALVRHDDLIAQVVEAHGGRFLRSMGEGDSTFSVFDSATAALDAAIAATQALTSEEWPSALDLTVRFGLHTGEAERHGTDYTGPAVNLAARLRGQAGGGQIFLSSVTAEVLSASLPEGYRLVDLGPHRLRGLRAPERVFALAGPNVAAPLPATECPYRGLQAFEVSDRRFFFGREEAVAEVVARVAPGSLLALVGASGSGKSSVLRAGLVGAAQDGLIAGVTSVELLTPGPAPTVDLPGPPDGLLVVDQFEELFTLSTDEGKRTAFIDALLAHLGPVVVGVRADFYGRLSTHPELARAVASNQILLGPMKPEELRRAITEPASCAGLRLEPGLVDVILRDVAGEPGALPLLSHALRATWELRDGRTLTVDGYRETGGVTSAIARTADRIVETTPDELHSLLRNVFLRLTEIGDGVEETRRRVEVDELVPEGGSASEVNTILDQLADARLITLREGTAEVAHEALIREWPALRAWLEEDQEGLRLQRRLGDAARLWAAGARETSDLYRGTRLEAAREWAENRPESLNATERAFLDASLELANRERADQAHQVKTQARTNRRLRGLLVSTSLLLIVALITGVVALLLRNRADRQATRARESAIGAEVDRIVAELPTILGSNRELGALLAVEADRLRPDPARRGALLGALTRDPAWRFTLHGGRAGYASLGVYPDGKRVAAMGRDGVDVWDVAARRRVGTFSVRASGSVAVSHDGGLIAVGTVDNTVVFRDGTTLRPAGPPLQVDGAVRSLAFAPDRRWLAIGIHPSGHPGTADALLLDAETRRAEPIPLDADHIETMAVAFSPDGRLLATGHPNGNIIVRDRNGTPIGPVLNAGGAVHTMAFAHDGRRLAVGTGSGETSIIIFDTQTGQASRRPPSPPGGFQVVAISPDDSTLAVAAENPARSGVVLQDTTTGQIIGAPLAAQHGSSHVAFLPDIGMVLSGSDGTLSAWAPGGPSTIARVIPGSPPAGGIYSPDGSILATPANDNTVTFYATQDLHATATLTISGPFEVAGISTATPVAFSPDGHIVAIGDYVGNVQLFDARSYRPLGPPQAVDPAYPLIQLVFSPDGRHVVATSGVSQHDNGAHVLTVSTGEVRALEPPVPSALTATFSPNGHHVVIPSITGGATVFPVTRHGVGRGHVLEGVGAPAGSAAFSPDGRVLAVGSQNGTIQLLDARTYRPRGAPVVVTPGLIVFVAFSPDSRLLLGQTIDASNRLFDVARRAPIGDAFPGSGAGYGIASFAPHGRTVALPGPPGTTLWDLDDAHWREQACRLAGRDLTQAEWAKYLSSVGAYRPTCST
jgi:WD40 repeat protein/class 3 adenylate cyclase